MTEALHSPRVIRFGIFEVDLQAGELRKAGVRLKLTGQPFQVLAILLERPGDVVTREELQKRLWPDTFVDVDHNLNTAINKIREVLGDSAEVPRFVETLPRRGYRFIGPLSHENASASGKADLVQLNGDTESGRATVISDRRAAVGTPPLHRWHGLAIALTSVVIIASAVAVYWLTRPPPPPRITRTVQLTNNGRPKAGELCTDGPRLYFYEESTIQGHSTIVQVSTTGGETVAVPTAFQGHNVVFPMDISPDGSELLVGTRTAQETELPLWIVPVLGGSPRRVGDVLVNYDAAAWSPDGQRIVYARGSDLYAVKTDGTDSRKLLTASGTPNAIRWSPDGKRVGFTLVGPQGQGVAIWEVAADGGNLHEFLPSWKNPHQECCGVWTADGKYFVFRAIHGNEGDLWVIREKNGVLHKGSYQPVRLAPGPADFSWYASSRDGKQIFALGRQARGELMRYDAKIRKFAPYLSGISASDVAFSRDGEWVCYVTVPQFILWRSKLDGSQKLQLTVPPMLVSLPRWSPDGQRIVFMGQMPGKTWKNHVVSVDGGTPQQLTPDEHNEADPKWSPDGNSILFGRLPDYWVPEPPEAKGLLLFNLKTNQIEKISGSDGLYSPHWSPDGRSVAAIDVDSRKLILFDLTTHQQVELASFAGGLGYPNWSRDGTWIQVCGSPASAGEEWGIYRIRVSDHKIERVVNAEELGPISSATGGTWDGLSPDDSLLVMRDHSMIEVYALDVDLP